MHALSQHTPSTHLPLPHSLPAAQMVPFTLVQVPSEPEMLHEKPEPVQVVLQQMPETQLPLVHALLAVHASPLIFLATHEPAAQ